MGGRRRLSSSSVLGVALLFLTLAIRQGSCLMCWECNSFWDWRCLDPFHEMAHDLTNCTHRNNNATMYVCRKLIQKAGSHTRVIRSCGFLPPYDPKRACYRRAGTYDVSVEYCHCTTDGCNGVSRILLAPLVTLLTSALVLVLR